MHLTVLPMLAVIFLAVNRVNCYKILVFSPATSKSHLISNGRLADELARAGHDVTVLELDFLQISGTTKSVKVAKKRIIGKFKHAEKFKEALTGFSKNAMDEPSFTENLKAHWAYQQAYNDLCAEFLEKDDIFYELKNEHFDGFFAEQINTCGFGYAHALGIERRFLIASCPFSGPVYELTGLPMPTSNVPFSTDMSVNPTYFERARNLLVTVIGNLENMILSNQLAAHFHLKFGENFPTPQTIARDVDVIFIATDEIIDISSTTLQNIVHVGGIGVDDDATDMDKIFMAEMQKGKEGVIYFSLGTVANTSTLDKQVMQSVLNIVQKYPDYHFLIRADEYDKNTRAYAKQVENAFVSDWLPQPAILHHPRLKMFITHSGYNSVVEAARAGVPLITIPFIFDQNLNSRAVERKGWGVRRDKRQLLTDPSAIEAAIDEILHKEGYTHQAHRIRDLIKSKPLSSAAKLVKTTEWAIKNGGLNELKFESRAEINITETNMNDALRQSHYLNIMWQLFAINENVQTIDDNNCCSVTSYAGVLSSGKPEQKNKSLIQFVPPKLTPGENETVKPAATVRFPRIPQKERRKKEKELRAKAVRQNASARNESARTPGQKPERSHYYTIHLVGLDEKCESHPVVGMDVSTVPVDPHFYATGKKRYNRRGKKHFKAAEVVQIQATEKKNKPVMDADGFIEVSNKHKAWNHTRKLTEQEIVQAVRLQQNRKVSQVNEISKLTESPPLPIEELLTSVETSEDANSFEDSFEQAAEIAEDVSNILISESDLTSESLELTPELAEDVNNKNRKCEKKNDSENSSSNVKKSVQTCSLDCPIQSMNTCAKDTEKEYISHNVECVPFEFNTLKLNFSIEYRLLMKHPTRMESSTSLMEFFRQQIVEPITKTLGEKNAEPADEVCKALQIKIETFKESLLEEINRAYAKTTEQEQEMKNEVAETVHHLIERIVEREMIHTQDAHSSSVELSDASVQNQNFLIDMSVAELVPPESPRRGVVFSDDEDLFKISPPISLDTLIKTEKLFSMTSSPTSPESDKMPSRKRAKRSLEDTVQMLSDDMKKVSKEEDSVSPPPSQTAAAVLPSPQNLPFVLPQVPVPFPNTMMQRWLGSPFANPVYLNAMNMFHPPKTSEEQLAALMKISLQAANFIKHVGPQQMQVPSQPESNADDIKIDVESDDGEVEVSPSPSTGDITENESSSSSSGVPLTSPASEGDSGAEKPFICMHNNCGKRFANKFLLKKHMFIHTGLRPHTCPHCHKK
ncbi:unnamed protein product [Caenorhabditis sp. 36 PRJEB53466]|nr:unnamed protein product [Caenorhabditis sp. 36 PRJEB53466]